jgi:serine/threonine-protein kinase
MEPAPVHFCPRCGTRRNGSGTCARDGAALAEVSAGSLLGTEVGNYVVVQLLGEGGMGAVYRAVQPAIGAEVAIKVLRAGSETQPGMVQRFLLEAQAVNRVRHAGLIKILDTGALADRRPYLVMELLDGISLADAIGKLTPALACHVAAEALEALDAVHAEGIVHRDLKPPNVFLTREGRVVVLDFGIAKLVGADGTAPITQSTSLLGTPAYMAPEQIRARPIDRRTDVYAMGIVLYELITGRRPFAAAATFDMLVQHVERPPASPRDWVPDLALPIAGVILRALEKDPERRFASAAEMSAALRAASGGATDDEVAAFVLAHAPARPQSAVEDPATVGAVHGAPPTTPIRGQREPSISVAGAPTHETEVTVDDGPKRRPTAPPPLASVPRPRAGIRRPLLIAGGVVAASALVVAVAATHTRGPEPTPDAPAPPPRVTSSVVPAQPTPDAPPVTDAEATLDGAAATGILEVRSNPPGATIEIDHLAAGVTPLTLDVSPGAHLVHAERRGYLAIDEAADVRAGERSRVFLRLPEARAATTQVLPHGSSPPHADDHGPSTSSTSSPGSREDADTGSAQPTGRRKDNPYGP